MDRRDEASFIQSFEVSRDEEFGDLLNRPERHGLRIGVYTAGWFEYWRMYPGTLPGFVRRDMQAVVDSLRNALDGTAELVWPGVVSTLDEADRAGRQFREQAIDLLVFVAATYTSDVMSLQCLRYLEGVPLLLLVRQSHRDIDFDSDYEQTLRNSGMIASTQLTGTFRKMGTFPSFTVVAGADPDPEPYRRVRQFVDALRVFHRLRELNVGVIGHVFRGMYDHEFDRTRLKGMLGPNVIDIQLSHFLDLWDRVTATEIADMAHDLAWVKSYPFHTVTDEDFLRECRFGVAYGKLRERFHLDAVCFLGQHYTEAKTGCTGYLTNVALAKRKEHMVNTEGDVNGLIMMCILNELSGQSPLFGEWGEFGIRENAMQMMMHGYADVDLAPHPSWVRFTATPEQWGYQGNGFSVEFTAKPGTVTVGHFLDTRNEGYRMLRLSGRAREAPHSIPCENVTLLYDPGMPIVNFVERLVALGVDHHAIICYGDYTGQLDHLAALLRMPVVSLP